MPFFCHSRAWRQDSRSTHSPIDRINPDSSANGMKSAGLTSPRVGWFQRSSASTLLMRPVATSLFGW
jgi:hypothetical protein